MKDFVSRHRTSVVGAAAATSLLLALLVPYGLPWAGRAWLSLTLPIAILLAMSPTLWLRREAAQLVVAVPGPRARRAGAAPLRLKEEGTP